MPDRAAPHQRAEELAGVGTWSIDLLTGGLTTNRAARRMLGWAGPDRPTLRDFLLRVHPGDRELVRTHTDALLRDGREYDVQHRVVLEDGRVAHMRAVATADVDEDGQVVAVHGITLDVTAMHLAARAAEAERDRSRSVLAALHEGYFVSAGGVIVEVNDALCRMTGYRADELVGAGTPYPFWPSEDVQALVELRRQLTETGGGQAQAQAQCKDGSRLRVALTAAGLATPHGEGPLWFVLVRDVTAEHEQAELLRTRAETDPLTGLPNSRTFRDALRVASATRPVSLALIDVDHFKGINDRYGHAVGDEVLVAVVDRLRTATSTSGTLARVGGEEFALLMPGLDEQAARTVLERALAALRCAPVAEVGTVTASAGVAALQDGMDTDVLYRLADRRLYAAKDEGRDRVC